MIIFVTGSMICSSNNQNNQHRNNINNMKQAKFLIPIVSAVLILLGSCIPTPSHPSQLDTTQIVEEIRSTVADRITENVQLKVEELTSSINDTIFSVNETGDTVKVAADDKNGVSVPLTVTIQELSIDVNSGSNDNYYRLQREHMKITMVTIQTIVIVSLVLLATIAVLIFFYRRYKSRNEIIAKAIENNYKLPDVFYSGSTETSFPSNFRINPTDDDTSDVVVNPDSTDGEQQPAMPPVYRNSRNFDKGWRNTAIGVGIIIIFNVWDAPAAAVLGIVPLFIGAGQLLSYYNIIKR